MAFWFIPLVLTLIVLLFIIINQRKQKHYFESKGIPYFGNGTIRLMFNTIRGISFIEDLHNQYKKMKTRNIKVCVSIDFQQPTLIVSDVELLKSILVKDFDHFVDRRKFAFSKNDWIFKKMLFGMRGEPWKQLRAKLSPTFTTGKIKRVFKLFTQSGKKFVKFVEEEMANSKSGEIDLTNGYSKYTMDIIASAVCGIDSKAFDQKEPSYFEQMGKALQFKFGGFQFLKFVLMIMLPTSVSNFLGLSFFDREITEFFSNAIKSSIQHRQATGEKRDDFVQLMLEARAGKLKFDDGELEAFEKDAMIKPSTEDGKIAPADLLDDDAIVANCILFILAGFDTLQSLLLFCAYLLALHQDIQEKLREEINYVLSANNGELTYDGLSRMTYLDMVINETLRYYPPAVASDRSCTIEYKIPETDYILRKDQVITIPTYGLHHDEQYFPEPEKFDPERFSQQNKQKINSYAFLPFGQGPRNCIGMRFALAEAKVVIAMLVHNFKIEPSPKTPIPMKFANTGSLKPDGGLFLSLNKI